MPRTKRLNQEMTRFLEDSGYGDPNEVVVLTDGARDLAGVANDLPYDDEWILDWAHIGRMLRRVDQAIAPLAYGRLRTVDQRSNCGICLSASAITFGPETQWLGSSAQLSSLTCLICVRNEIRQ